MAEGFDFQPHLVGELAFFRDENQRRAVEQLGREMFHEISGNVRAATSTFSAKYHD